MANSMSFSASLKYFSKAREIFLSAEDVSFRTLASSALGPFATAARPATVGHNLTFIACHESTLG